MANYTQRQHFLEVNQAGGKYGTFTCTLCGGRGNYKFSAASGWCDQCEAIFLYFGGIYVELDGREHADALIALEAQDV